MASSTQHWLAKLTKQYQGNLAVLLCLRALTFVSQVVCFWYFSQIMGIFIVEQSILVDQLISPFLLAAVSWILTKYLSQKYAQQLQSKVEKALQSDIQLKLNQHQHALSRQYTSYFWQHVWISHIPAISQFITQYQLQKMLSGLIPIFVIIAIIPINYFVAIILLITLPIVPLFMILVGKGAAELHQQHFIALERLGGLFVDRLKALTLLTSFNQHQRESSRLNDASNLLNRRTMRVVSIAFLSSSVLDFFSTIAIALIAVFIGFTLLGELSIGPNLSFNYGLYLLLIAPLIFAELKTLGQHYHQKAQAESAADAILPIVEKDEITKNNIVFTPVHWLNVNVYTPHLHAEHLNLTSGEHVLLKGDSGAGKTIFLEALMGLRKASHQLPGKCVLLSQHAVITSGSVRDNLILDHNITDQDLLSLLEKVELTTWLHQLENGLDTKMGEHPPLSGGEAQRLALARVLLQNADTLLLDEPTAHLTDEQHQQIAQLIIELFKTKSIIWASHKTLPDSWFDQKWLIDKGVLTCQ
ncbi:ABC transporter ATP-binding protein/permease [Thalassotalea piscium]